MSNHRDADTTEGLFDETNAITGAVIGAAIEVHRHLGPGYLESIYEEALAHELRLRSIAFERQPSVCVTYKGIDIGESRLDLLVEGEVLVELKAVTQVLPLHRAQLLSYLKMTDHRFGLLINFNVRLLRDGIIRLVWDDDWPT
jgi:GxxExxY protein